MKVEIIRPDGTRELYVYQSTGTRSRLREMYDIISGGETDPAKRCHTVEHITPASGGHLWMDEDGRAHGLAVNREATKIYREAGGIPGEPVVGIVILETPERRKR